MSASNKPVDKILKRNAWTVSLIATIVLLTSVCGIGTYRIRLPQLPPPARPAHLEGIQYPVGLSPDGHKLAYRKMQAVPVEVLEIGSGKSPVALKSSQLCILVIDVEFSWDGKSVVARCNSTELTIWNTATGEVTHSLKCPIAPHFVAAWSRDGGHLASACARENAKVWEFPSGKEISTFWLHDDTVTGLAFTPEGHLVSSGNDGFIRFADVSGNILRSHQFGDHVKGFVLRSDGKEIVAVTGGAQRTPVKVFVWELDSEKHRALQDLETDTADLLALSPDGAFLILHTASPTAIFWLRKNRYLKNLGIGLKKAVFTDDGRIVGIGYNAVEIWPNPLS